MMRHDPKWATFNSAYINEKVEFHLQNAFLDEPMEDGLIKFFTHISIMRDPRASYDMVPDEVWSTLPPDPDIAALEAQRDKLKEGRFRIQGTDVEKEVRRLSNEIRNKRAQRNKALRQEYRKYYFYNRPTWDIEKQMTDGFEEDEEEDGEASDYTQPPIELHIPERARLAEILCHHSDNLNSGELRSLRIEATQLMTALCSKRETARRKYIRRTARADTVDGIEMPIKEESPDLDRFPLLMEKTQCPCCIGCKALSEEERAFRYCRPAVMNDHFDREHLKPMKVAEECMTITCEHPRCQDNGEGLKLQSLDHFRSHVQRVHGVCLRPERR